jgi:hypothetical protein
VHWIWENAIGSENEAMIYGVPDSLRPLLERGLAFDHGVRSSASVPLVVVTRNADSQGTLNDNLVAPGTTGLLLSSKLRTALAAGGVDNIEYFPTRIDNPQDGSTTDDYRLANIIGCIACVDLEKSALQMHPDLPGTIEFIDSLVLDESRIRGHLCFRLKEFRPVVVVHDQVKQACEAAGVTGVRFVPPEEFSL